LAYNADKNNIENPKNSLLLTKSRIVKCASIAGRQILSRNAEFDYQLYLDYFETPLNLITPQQLNIVDIAANFFSWPIVLIFYF
jgi:hypothetical protein